MRSTIVLALAAALLAAGAGAWAWYQQPHRWAERRLEEVATLTALQQRDAARAGLRTLLQRLPRHRAARWQLIQLELEQRRYEQAYLELKAFTELFPEVAEAWLLVASLMNSGGLLEEAEAAADQAVAAAPTHAEARTLRATVRLRRGRFHGASLDARVALDQAMADAALWSVLSQAVTAIEGPAAGAEIARRGLRATNDDPLLRVVLGKRLLESGDVAAAEAALRAVAGGEAQRAAQLLLARSAIRRGRIADAERVLDALIEARPADVEATVGRALLEAAAGRVTEALARLEPLAALAPGAQLQGLRQALTAQPDDRAALRRLLANWADAGLAAPQGGQPPEPSRIRRAPARQRGQLAEGHAMVWPGTLAELRRDSDRHIQAQQWDEARAVARRAEQAYPGSVIGPWIEGVLALARGELDTAERRFDAALRRAPRSVLVTKALAQVWQRQRDAAGAAERTLGLAAADPGFDFARRHAASLYLDARRPDLAEAALRGGLTDAAGPGPYADLAQFYLELDRPDDARRACQDGLARFPDDPALQALRAQLLLRAGDPDAAVAQLETLLRAQPDRTADAVVLAGLLATRPARQAQARALLLGASFDAPLELAVVDGVGWGWLQAGEPRRALPWLEAAARAAPEHAAARYHLAVAYARLNRRAEARAEVAAALAGGAPFAEQAEARKLLESLQERF